MVRTKNQQPWNNLLINKQSVRFLRHLGLQMLYEGCVEDSLGKAFYSTILLLWHYREEKQSCFFLAPNWSCWVLFSSQSALTAAQLSCILPISYVQDRDELIKSYKSIHFRTGVGGRGWGQVWNGRGKETTVSLHLLWYYFVYYFPLYLSPDFLKTHGKGHHTWRTTLIWHGIQTQCCAVTKIF